MKNFTLTLAIFMLLNIVATHAQQPGTLDNSFGKKGKLSTKPGSYPTHIAYAAALQADGKIVVTGHAVKICCDGLYFANYATVRYMPDGEIDSAFGGNGYVATSFGNSDYYGDHAFSVAIQNNGKIVVGGTCYKSSEHYNFGLARYTSKGTPDSAFGKNGQVQTDINGNDWGRSIAIQPDGKIVAGGNYLNNSSVYRLVLVRYTTTGELDTIFGNKGKVISPLTDNCRGYSVAVQADGKILLAGIDLDKSEFVIQRFTQIGLPDSSFNSDGTLITNLGKPAVAGIYIGPSITVQPDGKFLLTGTINNGSNNDMVVMRFLPGGKLDKDFADNGKYIYDGGGDDYAYAVKLQVNNKIVVAGASNDNFALVRFKQTGKLDSTFGTNGIAITDFGKYGSEAHALVMQPDGKIVAAGEYANKFAVARYYGYTGTTEDITSNLQKQNIVASTAFIVPNPVKDVLHVQGLSSNHLKLILLINADGRLLQRATTISSTQSFNVKQLPAGIYFIKIEENNTSTTMRFMKE